jgi:hypothetical protein
MFLREDSLDIGKPEEEFLLYYELYIEGDSL